MTTPTLFDICAAGAQVAAMRDPRNPALNALADLLAEELIAVHQQDVAPQYIEAVKKQRADRMALRSKANAAAINKMQTEGPEMWAEWHQRALKWKDGSDATYLSEFAARIPCSDCKSHFIRLVQDNQPDFTAANYFDYTVKIHNLVSLNCNPPKPQLSVEQARSIWS